MITDNPPTRVHLTVELTTREAHEYSQFLKRVGFSDYKSLCEPGTRTGRTG